MNDADSESRRMRTWSAVMRRVASIVTYRVVNPVRSWLEARTADRRYAAIATQLRDHRPTSDLAVVVHVFYPEVWPAIRERLALLGVPFDLYVSVSAPDAAAVADEIAAQVPNAVVVVVPNRGRDVLPFIRICRALVDLGYTGVLKLHSKRSVHATDGAEFLDDCVRSLIPSAAGSSEIWSKIRRGEAAVVGPRTRYYPALIHVWHNMADLRRKTAAWGRPALTRDDLRGFGFFAGTMFWARVDAIRPCLEVATDEFQIETGQIDATMAHALERLFCLIPEQDGRPIYSSGDGGLVAQAYADYTWPDWALRKPDWE